MAIVVHCENCHGRFSAPDSGLGKTGKCPRCGNRIQINAEPPPVVAVAANRVAGATRESSNRVLWVVGSIVLVAIMAATGILILTTVESEPVAAELAEAKPATDETATAEAQGNPFEYKILSEEWHDAFVGRAVTVKAQVADDVAPTVTEADLAAVVPYFMAKYDAGTFQVFFYAKTPLVQAWGVISHNPYKTVGDKLEFSIHKYAFEMGPWYFPDRIDSKTEWHELVWLTLPMVNKIVNGSTQYHWEVTDRSANEIYFDSKQSLSGAMKDDMYLSPQSWDISTYDGDVPRFVRLVESSLNHLDYEFSQNIVGKLNSVIGSQEYLNGDKTYWTWMIGRLEVTYHHFNGNDSITIMQTRMDGATAK